MAGRTIRSMVLKQQLAWAEREGKKVGPTGYLDTAEDNLFLPMSPTALARFSAGTDGGLLDAASRPAKIKALHSSTALAVNVFDYRIKHNAAPASGPAVKDCRAEGAAVLPSLRAITVSGRHRPDGSIA